MAEFLAENDPQSKIFLKAKAGLEADLVLYVENSNWKNIFENESKKNSLDLKAKIARLKKIKKEDRTLDLKQLQSEKT